MPDVYGRCSIASNEIHPRGRRRLVLCVTDRRNRKRIAKIALLREEYIIEIPRQTGLQVIPEVVIHGRSVRPAIMDELRVFAVMNDRRRNRIRLFEQKIGELPSALRPQGVGIALE